MSVDPSQNKTDQSHVEEVVLRQRVRVGSGQGLVEEVEHRREAAVLDDEFDVLVVGALLLGQRRRRPDDADAVLDADQKLDEAGLALNAGPRKV